MRRIVNVVNILDLVRGGKVMPRNFGWIARAIRCDELGTRPNLMLPLEKESGK